MSHIRSALKRFTCVVAYDDTTTTVRVFADEPYENDAFVAVGVAKRTEGDTRDPQIGLALATGRAFEAMAKREFEFADAKLNPPPPPEREHPQWLKDFAAQLRRLPEVPEPGSEE